MFDLVLFALISGAGAAFLAAGYILFNLALFLAYKAGGGRRGLIPYLKKHL